MSTPAATTTPVGTTTAQPASAPAAPGSEPRTLPRGRTPRIVRAIAFIVGLAVVMFGAGAIAISVDEDTAVPPPAGVTGPVTSAERLSQPGLAGSIAALQSRLRAVPNDWQSLAALGSAYVEQARVTGDATYYPKAQDALERSLRLDAKRNFAATTGLGALAAARHDFTDALRWADRGLAINPDNAPLHGVRTDALVELGRYDEAERSAQRMLDLRPGLPSYARASYLLELRGDVPGALQTMQLALESAATPGDAAFATYYIGELHESAGRALAAAASYQRAAALDPAAPAPREGLARLDAAAGRTAPAIAAYERLAAERPLPQYAAALVELYVAAGRPADAQAQRDLLAVQTRLLEAGGVNPDLELALWSADGLVSLPGAVTVARAEWDRRHSVHVADALAWVLYDAGRYAEARTYADQALRLGTRNASFHYHRGMIALALGDEATARRDLRAALTINPAFSMRHAAQARRALAQLGASR